jgi:hypothetical protein
MKRWAILTILLYLLCLSFLVLPLFILASSKNLGAAEGITCFYVYFIPVLILIQMVLLLVPIDIVRERPIKRRKIIVSAVIVSILMVVLTTCFISFNLFMIWGEDGLDIEPGWQLLTAYFAFVWLVWGIVFYKGYSKQSSISFNSQLIKWLLRGSILELLVAIPSHIISRHRDECCAPIISLYGIATGLAIALLSFGPGVFFLFARRVKSKRGRQNVKIEIA